MLFRKVLTSINLPQDVAAEMLWNDQTAVQTRALVLAVSAIVNPPQIVTRVVAFITSAPPANR